MRWTRLEIPCPPELTEVVAALVLAETGRGASIASVAGESLVEGWVLRARAEQVGERLAKRLAAAGPRFAGAAAGMRAVPVADVDWRLAWREHFRPLRVGERLVIKPSWEPWPPPGDPSAARDDDVVVELDPGGAFGTGSHQTTQLALCALERLVKAGDVVVDVGCGSGILSLAALALGAKRAIGVDTDPAAIECAASNLRRPLSLGACQLVLGDALNPLRVVADVVVANISAEAAAEIGRQAPRALGPRGRYIATGFLATASQAIEESLRDVGLVVREVDELEGWSCLSLVRPESGQP